MKYNRASTFSLILRFTCCTVLIAFCTNSYAVKIYKWTDATGKTHYSSMPPAQQETRTMGSTNSNRAETQSTEFSSDDPCKDATKAELLVGVWRLKSNNKTRIRFYDIWRGEEVKTQPRQLYFIDVQQGNTQSGHWSLAGNKLKLKIDKLGKAHNHLKKIKKARIHKLNNKQLYLLINDTQPMQFNRDNSSGLKPKCMRKKRRHDD